MTVRRFCMKMAIGAILGLPIQLYFIVNDITVGPSFVYWTVLGLTFIFLSALEQGS